MKPTILITGAHSLLGKYLAETLSKSSTLILTSHRETDGYKKLDVTEPNEVSQVMKKYHPDAIIHLASLSNIDHCESHPKEAEKVNIHGTKNLIDVPQHSPHLIFLSSSMVFDGTHPPYTEYDIPNPIHVYGKTKMEAEHIVKTANFPTAIIRSSTMFGYPPKGTRENDLTLYLNRLQETKPLHLVDDRFFNPISAKSVAETIAIIINKKATGIFHLGGKTTVSRYTFVQTLAKVQKKSHPKLIPVKSNFFPQLALRPLDVTLSTKKAEKDLGFIPKTLEEELSTLI